MARVSRVAVLDDYQQVARRFADWDTLPDGVTLTVFDRPFDGVDDIVASLEPFDVVVAMRERTRFDATVLRRLPRLGLLVTTGPSNAAIDLDAARDRGVVVSGTRPGGIVPAAELTWGLILALARHIPTEDGNVRRGDWQTSIGTELRGRRLGVVGLGEVGGAVARVGVAFGMDVVAWSPHLDPDRARAVGVTAVEKRELLTTSDVVTLHLKLSERSAGVIGRHDIDLMKNTVLLVNTSRGQLVDEAALLDALIRGTIGGAGLDVFAAEPLAKDSPWRHAPRTVLTPHLGYVSDSTYAVFYGDAVEDIGAYIADAPVRVLTS